MSSPDSPDVELQGKFNHTYISFCLFVYCLSVCLSPSKTKPVISYSIHWYNYNKFVPCIFVVLWRTHYLKAYLLLQLLLHCWQFIVSLRIIRKQPNYCRWLLHMTVPSFICLSYYYTVFFHFVKTFVQRQLPSHMNHLL